MVPFSGTPLTEEREHLISFLRRYLPDCCFQGTNYSVPFSSLCSEAVALEKSSADASPTAVQVDCQFNGMDDARVAAELSRIFGSKTVLTNSRLAISKLSRPKADMLAALIVQHKETPTGTVIPDGSVAAVQAFYARR